MIVMEQTYEVTDPTIDSQIVNLKARGANVFFNVDDARSSPCRRSEGVRHRLEAAHFLNNVSSSLVPCSSRPAWTSRPRV